MTSAVMQPALRGWRVLLNVAAFQAAWFACVALAARGQGGWAVLAVAAAIALHFALTNRPRVDAALIAIAMAIGALWDTSAILAGLVSYASPGPWKDFAPPWILALWALFATALREPLRWMHSRPLVAALFGAVGGPLSYAAAERMGACTIAGGVWPTALLAAAWAAVTPLLVQLAQCLEARAGKSR